MAFADPGLSGSLGDASVTWYNRHMSDPEEQKNEATSGEIPESLDEAVSLAKSLGLMDSIRSEKDPARAVEMTVDYFRLRGFLPTTPPSQV